MHAWCGATVATAPRPPQVTNRVAKGEAMLNEALLNDLALPTAPPFHLPLLRAVGRFNRRLPVQAFKELRARFWQEKGRHVGFAVATDADVTSFPSRSHSHTDA